MAQLVEHCTSIAEVRVWVPLGQGFFRSFFCHCLSTGSITKLRRSLALKLFPSAVQMKFYEFDHRYLGGLNLCRVLFKDCVRALKCSTLKENTLLDIVTCIIYIGKTKSTSKKGQFYYYNQFHYYDFSPTYSISVIAGGVGADGRVQRFPSCECTVVSFDTLQ